MGSLIPQGVGAAKALGDTTGAQFIVALLGGLVTFGGAYTSVSLHYSIATLIKSPAPCADTVHAV
jgi:hypothetical protein